jgi:Ca-activated chloride channel homolog
MPAMRRVLTAWRAPRSPIDRATLRAFVDEAWRRGVHELRIAVGQLCTYEVRLLARTASTHHGEAGPRRKETTLSRSVRNHLRTTLAWLTLLALAPLTLAQTSILLVLDASGSMFLTLPDGQYRITAAKAALTEFVTRLPDDPNLNVGLRTYGSRIAALEDGACQDSHLFVPVEGFERDTLLNTIRATQAKGATPIALSLQLTANDLQDAPGRRIIILVTDGAESCGGDVRAAVEHLTAAGLEVDIRIIGFALSDTAIRSFTDLGTFENTTSAAELAAALGRAAELAPATATHDATVTLTRRGEPATEGATVRFIDAVGGNETTFTTSGGGVFTATLPAGSYRAEITDAYATTPLTVAGLTITPDTDNTFQLELQPTTETTLTITPQEPTASSTVTVHYENAPPGDRNWITVVPTNTDDDVYLDWSYIGGASGEVTLRLPDAPGTLEARYLLSLPEGGTQVVGRSQPFTSTAVAASLRAQDEVAAGASFDVSWTGPNQGSDFITVVPTGADDDAYQSYVYADRGSPNRLTASVDPGSYEIRYVTGQSNTVLARRPLLVTEVTARVEAPTELVAGASFSVTWTGPNNGGDYITIVPAGADEGAYRDYAYTDAGSPVTLRAPVDAGAYEVRYVTGQGDRTLTSAPTTVSEAATGLRVPREVAAGTAFEVDWTGPNNGGDYITIVPAGADEGSYLDYAYTDGGNPSTLKAPVDAGAYEVRYVAGQGDRTLASAPITITGTTASVEAPAVVASGSTFEVGWTGPGNDNDYVTIVPAGADEGSYLDYAYLSSGNPATLTAPEEAGRYEVRYVFGGGDRTLASAPIEVR